MHGYDENGERERLLSLSGEPREIIRDRDRLTCIWPGSKSIVEEPRRARLGFPTKLAQDIESTADYYAFSVDGTERVAGLKCRMISIWPRDEFRYGYRLCLEDESGMLLRYQMLDSSNEIIEQVMFTSIKMLEHIPSERFEPTPGREGYTLHRAKGSVENGGVKADPAWSIADAPPGFVLSSNVKRPVAASEEPVQHMILTDGLASVSVFIATTEPEEDIYEGLTHTGALHAYARVTRGHQVTVVGEVPAETVRRIGESLHYAQEELGHD